MLFIINLLCYLKNVSLRFMQLSGPCVGAGNERSVDRLQLQVLLCSLQSCCTDWIRFCSCVTSFKRKKNASHSLQGKKNTLTFLIKLLPLSFVLLLTF